VLFLEDSFGESHAEKLRRAGYAQVERFVYHFQDERTEKCEQSVKDPKIIRYCASHKWMLVTTDSNMACTHVETIKKTDIAILATAHNSAEDMDEWVEGLIDGRAAFERFFKKVDRPSFATFNRQGKITSERTITPERYTKRKRPREGQELTASL
jgi:hypothetical protein